MLLDKPYWISKNDEQLHFETMSLLHLRNIINLIKRNYKSPELHPTYNYAIKIYDYRLQLLAKPLINNGIHIGWIKNDKIYIKAEYCNEMKYDELIRNHLEERFMNDTRIPIGFIDFKGVINENQVMKN